MVWQAHSGSRCFIWAQATAVLKVNTAAHTVVSSTLTRMNSGSCHLAGSVCARAYSSVNGLPISRVIHVPSASAPLAMTPRWRMVHMLWKPTTAMVAALKKIRPTHMMMPRCSLSTAITTDATSAAARPISTRSRVSLAMTRKAIHGAKENSSLKNDTMPLTSGCALAS